MTWVKLDDKFPQHPKLLRVSTEARWAFLVAICYSAEYETDGLVPPSVVSDATADQLVAAGLLDVNGDADGWAIHDFLHYQPSHAELEAKRAADAERKQRSRRMSGRTPHGRATESNAPGPVPVPLTTKSPADADASGSSMKTKAENPVTHDQLYLAGKIEREWGQALRPSAIQRLNTTHGTAVVESVMRRLVGFPPGGDVRDAFAYIDAVCRSMKGATA